MAVHASSFYPFVACLWLLLFFGGCCLPAASGILVSIVPYKFRTISSSFSLMTFNIFGYFLSLCVSGYIMEVRGPC
jgi:MFS family permease